jgi:hypothetical protein
MARPQHRLEHHLDDADLQGLPTVTRQGFRDLDADRTGAYTRVHPLWPTVTTMA